MAGTAACSSSRAAVRSSKAGMNMRHCYALKGEGKVKRNSGLRTSRLSGLFFAILATGLSLGYALASEEELSCTSGFARDTAAMMEPAVCDSQTPAQGVDLRNRHDIPAFGMSLFYPSGWSVAPRRYVNMEELIDVPADQQNAVEETTRIKIRVQRRTNHDEALRELREIS